MTSDQDCVRPHRIDANRLRLLVLAAVTTAALGACSSPEPETAFPTPISTPTSSAAPSGATATPSDDEAAILAANANQTRWMIDADVQQLGQLLDDGFTAIHISGYEQSKTEWLDQIRSGQMT